MNTNLKLATQILSNGFENGKNIICSPALLEVMLCMLIAGAKGRTLEQLLSFVGAKSINDVNIKFVILKVLFLSKDRSLIDNDKKGIELYSANGIWMDKSLPVTPTYKETLYHIYDAEVKAVNFVNEADQIVEEANEWISKATKGLITSILPTRVSVERTSFILANALCFKGAWAKGYVFDPLLTEDGTFHLIDGQRVCASFMVRVWHSYAYKSQKGFQILKIPYEDTVESLRFAMYFFLPEKKNGLKTLMRKLKDDSELFANIGSELEQTYLFEVIIPKFKLEYEFEASTCMKELGLTQPFHPVKELTGIVPSPHGNQLYVKDILQKAYIEVDEKGTESAARPVMYGGGGRLPKESFIADHPFMFMIREDSTGTVLFMGAVLNPHK